MAYYYYYSQKLQNFISMGNFFRSPEPVEQVGDYEYNPNDLLGIGSHGILFEGHPILEPNFLVAIKETFGTFKAEKIGEATKFIEKMMKLHHPNIAVYVNYHFTPEGKLYLISEHCPNGNFHELLHEIPNAHPI